MKALRVDLKGAVSAIPLFLFTYLGTRFTKLARNEHRKIPNYQEE